MPTQIRRRSFLWAADRSTARCGLPEGLARTPKRPARVTGRASPPLLFGLAPRGVYRAADIAARAVGSYPTVSPLPSATIERPAGGFASSRSSIRLHRRFIFCGTVRSPAPAFADARSPGVTRRVALRSPDFPPGRFLCRESSSDRPARSLPVIIAHRVMCSLHTLGSPMRMNRVCEGLKCGVLEVA